jgi:hypothetical protein
VFRAAVLSTVLTLALGPNAKVVCITWCDAHAPAASGCQHENSGPSAAVTADESCDTIVPDTPALVREDVRRIEVGSDTRHTAIVPRSQFALSITDVRFDPEPGHGWSLEKRPLVTALRI